MMLECSKSQGGLNCWYTSRPGTAFVVDGDDDVTAVVITVVAVEIA